MPLYAAYGLTFACERLVRAAQPAPEGALPDVRIVYESVELSGVEFIDTSDLEVDEKLAFDMGWDDRHVVVRYPKVVAALPLDKRIIAVDDHESPDPDYTEHVLLDHLLPRWIGLQGEIVLHGAALVAPSGGAIAFIGQTGQGKSSLATGLADLGWPLLTDDACRVRTKSGVRWIEASYPGVRLTAESRAALTPGRPSLPMAEGASKHRVALPGPTVAGAEFQALVLLGDDTETVSLSPASLPEATVAIVSHSFQQPRQRSEFGRLAFEHSSQLAAAVPCFRLNFPRRWDVYPEIAHVLEQAHAR